AYDFLEKPLSLAKLIVTAERAIEHNQLNLENRQLKQKQPNQFLPIGKSKSVMQLRETIERLSKFTMPILVTGESGTGKHHFAEALHKTSQRQKNPFVQYHALDFNELCLPENLEKLKKALREAHQGTMVIAHIEQLSKEAQAQISNIVLKQCYQVEQSSKAICIDIRVIALTKCDLESEVERKAFREDLYQRLKVMQIHIPALRQRTEDIPELIDFYVDHFVTFEGLEYRHFSVSAQNILRQHNWPGNLKELKNHIQRLLILGNNEVTDDEVKELLISSQASNSLAEVVDTNLSLKAAKENFEGRYLSQLLRETSGNVSETAKRSGVDRTNLYRKLKALGIDPKNPQ
ncbi:MAG: sigma 54-interacting transcriptional regulator, partial [Thiomicrorhabdus sp.]|nr:sigma 54-interacting transcriptional regulator [Thiomicrorhabdus sp.]